MDEQLDTSGSIQQIENLEDQVVSLTSKTVALRKEKAGVEAQLRTFNEAIAQGKTFTKEQADELVKLTARDKELAASVSRSTSVQRTARQELSNLKFASTDARQEAQLLAAQFGVNLPRGLDQLITRIPGVQKAISAAFVIAPVVALGAGIVALFPVIAELIDKFRGIGPALDEQVQHIQNINRILVPITSVGGAEQNVSSIFNQIREAERLIRRQNELVTRQAGGGATPGETRELRDIFDRAKKAREELAGLQAALKKAEADLAQQQARATDRERKGDRAGDLERQRELVGLSESEKLRKQIEQAGAAPVGEGGFASVKEQLAQIALFEAQLTEAVKKEVAERIKQREKEADELEAVVKRIAAAQEQFAKGQLTITGQIAGQFGIEKQTGAGIDLDVKQKRLTQRAATLEEIQRLEEDAAIKLIDPTRRALAEIDIAERRRVAEYKRLLDENLIFEKDFQAARVAIARDAEAERILAAQEAAEEQQRLIQDQAREWESMFDRVVGSAKSAKDVLNNIWREMANEFKHQLFEMLAAWSAGSRGGTGGIGSRGSAGGILPAIFGGGGFGIPGAGPGGTPPFIPPSSQFASSGFAREGGFAPAGTLGDPLGIGASQSGAVAPVRTAPTTAATLGFPSTTPFGDLFGPNSRVFKHGAGPVSGGNLALAGITIGGLTIGNRSRLVSTLGGAASGALLGFSVAGPIGAAVGAVAGAAVGFFTGGSGKTKRADTAIEEQFFAFIRGAVDDFERHRRDYGSTIDAMRDAWAETWPQFQRDQSKKNAGKWFTRYVEYVQGIEDERNRRRGFLAGWPVPEFAAGGFVAPGSAAVSAAPWASGTLAVLHPGEFVMRRQAVDTLGVGMLERMNAAPAISRQPLAFSQSFQSGGLVGFTSSLDRFTERLLESIPRSEPRAVDGDSAFTVTVRGISKAEFAKLVNEAIPTVITMGGPGSRKLRA